MKKIKIFTGSYSMQLEAEVNDWIEKEKPMISSIRLSTNNSDNKCILIYYRES